MKKSIIAWVLAVLITLLAAFYQRTTGPTYPKKENIELSGKTYKFDLLRSHVTSSDCDIKLEIPGNISGNIFYKRLNTNDNYDTVAFKREGNFLLASLPKQAAAGKLQYYLELTDGVKVVSVEKEKNVIIRFKGDVPAFVLIPHILLMFFAMLFANLTGILAIFKAKSTYLYSKITIIILFVGGMILGPIVQKYAFGEFWTGIPFGWDLTDNKTLIALIFWLIAFVAFRKTKKFYYIIGAAIIMLIVYCIPHSLFGSQLNYETGKVMTGFINLPLFQI
jgi:hypothetical protein